MSLITNDAIMQHFGYPGAVNDKVRAFFNALYTGSGSPEGVTTAATGAFYLDTTNGALYAKQSGSGNIGWIAGIAPGSGSGPYVPAGVVVTSYGATTTAADNTAAVNAAITAAGTSKSVYLPDGDFICEGPVLPLSGQSFDGPGRLKRKVGSTHDLIQITGKSLVRINVALDGAYTGTYSTGNSASEAATGNLVNISGGSTMCKVTGDMTNNQGNAVRIYDSSLCRSSGNIDNCQYGVVIGSGGTAGDPGAVCNYNTVESCSMQYLGKNGVYITGRTDSGENPNTIIGHAVTGVSIFQPGDTGIEIGQGSRACVVSGVNIDGNNLGYNGILIRDGSNHSISGFHIENFPMFANGGGTYLTLGNGIYFWPQYTGQTTGCSVGPGTIKNCSRGVFMQGQNTAWLATDGFHGGAGAATFTDAVLNSTTTLTSATATFASTDVGKTITGTGIPASTTISAVGGATSITLSAAATATATGVSIKVYGRTVQGGHTITGVTVDGTQTGTVTGADATALALHGFYLQSASGVTMHGCIAMNCLNDGFRLGDTAQGSSYLVDAFLGTCMAFDNGQQNTGGQNYYGFNIVGTANGARNYLSDCHATDTRPSGSKTQTGGYNWNGNASGGMTSGAALVNCSAVSNKTLAFNNCGSANIRRGTVSTTAASASVATTDSVYVLTGTTAGQTVTLPAITTVGIGREIRIINNSSQTWTVAKSGGGTLNVTSLATLTEHIFVSDGVSNWW